VGLAGCTAVRRSPVGDALRAPPERRVPPDWRPGPGTWAADAHGPTNTGHNPHASPPRRAPGVDWRVDLPAGASSPAVAAGRVYCAARRRLVAFDAATGAVDWERPLGAPGRLTYVDGRLYVTDTDEDVAAPDPDGTERWRTAVDAGSLKRLHEQSGYVFLGTFSGHRVLHADTGRVVRSRDAEWEFLAPTGERLWERPVSGDVRLAVAGDRLYVADGTGVAALRG
jgi:outer membrane protein assembly factor BamB